VQYREEVAREMVEDFIRGEHIKVI